MRRVRHLRRLQKGLVAQNRVRQEALMAGVDGLVAAVEKSR